MGFVHQYDDIFTVVELTASFSELVNCRNNYLTKIFSEKLLKIFSALCFYQVRRISGKECTGYLTIQINTVDVFGLTPMVREMGSWDDQDPVLAARMRERAAGEEPTPEDNAHIFVWLASSASDGYYGRNFTWNMNTSDLERLKPRIVADERALRMEMVEFDGIGLSEQGRAYLQRLAVSGG